ncbi:MAG: tape measure protein [Cyanobacteria bacterium P01_C01_bin.120]
MTTRELQLKIALARAGLNQDAAGAAATIQAGLQGIEAQVGVDRQKLEAELRAVEAFTRGAFDEIPVGFSVDADGKLRNELGQFVEVTKRQIEVGLQGLKVDLELDQQGVKLAEKAIKELGDETLKTAQQAKFLKQAYNLSDKEVNAVIRKMGELERETKNAKNSSKGLQGAIAGLAGGAAFKALDLLTNSLVAAGEALKAFIGNAVRLGNEADQSRVAFETILGSADEAKTVLQDLTDFAATTPFEFTGVRQAGQSLLAFNFQADELKPTLTAIGDIASGVGTDFNELATIYGKARVQGRLFAEDVNQLTERGIPIIQEFAEQFGVADSEVKKLVEEGKIGFPELEQAFISLTSEGGKFFGLMEKQSQTFGGQLSNVNDTIDQFSIKLFNAFEPALSGGLQTFSDIIGEAAAQSDGLDDIADAAGRLKAQLEGNPELAERLGLALARVFDEGVDQISAVIDAITALVSNEDFIESFAEDIERLVGVIQVIGNTVRFVIALAEGFGTLRQQAKEIPVIGEAISDILSGVPPGIVIVKAAIEGLVNAIQRALEAVGILKAEAAQTIKGVGDDLAATLDEANQALSDAPDQVTAPAPDTSEVEQSAEELKKAVVEANAEADAAIIASQQARIEETKRLQLEGAISAEEAAQRIKDIERQGIDETIAARQAELERFRELKAQGAISAEEFAAQERQINEDIGNLNLERLDRELEAQRAAAEERKRLAFETAQAEIEARQTVNQQEQDLLDARGNLASALNTLEQERLQTAIAQAKASGDEAGAAQLTQQLKAAEVQAEQQAFQLKRQQLELQIQQNKLEAELALIRAQANGASEQEIANLQKQIALVDELANLQRQTLDAEEQIAAENRKQAELADIEPPSTADVDSSTSEGDTPTSPSTPPAQPRSTSPSIPIEELEKFANRPNVFSRRGDEFQINGETVEEAIFRAVQSGIDLPTTNPDIDAMSATAQQVGNQTSNAQDIGQLISPVLDKMDRLETALLAVAQNPRAISINSESPFRDLSRTLRELSDIETGGVNV